MKHIKKLLSFVIAVALIIGMLPMSAFAAESNILTGSCGENCTFSYDKTTYTLTISGVGVLDYSSVYNMSWDYGVWEYENLIIGEGISEIDYSCFSYNTHLTYVELPDSLIYLDSSAFAYTSIKEIKIPKNVTPIRYDYQGNLYYEEWFSSCDQLEIITVDEENPYLSAENGSLYSKDKKVLFKVPQATTGKVSVPDGVEIISRSAFYGCQVSEISLPTTLKEVQDYAFGCENLTEIIIPEGVETVSYEAFPFAKNLTYVYIPSTAQFTEGNSYGIGFYFSDCVNLESLVVDENNPYYTAYDKVLYNKDKTKIINVLPTKTGVFDIPEGVEELGAYCFAYCPKITVVNIPSTLKELSSISYETMDNPFRNCHDYYVVGNCIDRYYSIFAEINVSDQNETFSSESGVLFDKEKTQLIAYPQGKKDSSYTVPEGVEMISSYAFCYTDKLETIILPSAVSNIERFAIYYAQGLNSIIVMNASCFIEYSDDTNQAYTSYGNSTPATIYGYKDSTAEEYAYKASLEFVNINQAEKYYSIVGNYGIIVKDEKGFGITGYTISFDGQSITSDSMLTYIELPDSYIGVIEISKDGYISIVRSAADLNKYNFFVLHPDSDINPIVQQFNLYNKTYGGAYSDLLRHSEYIYDLEIVNYDIYLDVNYNGNDICAMYLQQGQNTIPLVNGKNTNISLNGSFNSDGGTIYFCMLSSDGTIYKINSKIVALPTRQELEFSQTGEMSTEIDESIDGIGGFGIDVKLPVPNLPISIKINSDGSFKGTVGIKSKNYNATYYEQISETIKKISTKTAGQEDVDSYSTTEMAKLEKYIKEGGGELISSSANVGIDVDMKFVGCIEGKLSEQGGLETFDISLIASISGSVSYTQQSAVLIGVVPIPYYWTVEAKAELAAALKIAIKEGNDDAYFDLPTVNLPEITAKVALSGELCAGVNKIIGGGARLTGAITLELPGLGKDLDESVVTLNIDFEVVGQIAGFEGTWTPFGDHLVDYQIYPYEDTQAIQLVLQTELLSRNYLNSASTLNLTSYSNSEYKTNTYTYTNPQIAQLSNGDLVMVWMDDDAERSDINRTALFYSIYNYWDGQWSTPTQINNDGTTDYSPVLKVMGEEIYVAWNNASTQFDDSASFKDVLKATEICVAKFNGTAFENITTITSNQYMDVVSSLNYLNGVPTITWISNSENDITGQTGNNSIYISELIGAEWENKLVVENLHSINSAVSVYENNEVALYYSMDIDNSVLTATDIEIFKCSNHIISQITDNTVNDTYLVSTDAKVYWNSDGCITDGNNVYECVRLYSDFQIVSDGEKDIALYSSFDASGVSSVYAVNCDVDSESGAFEGYGIYGTIGDFSATFDFETGEVILATNEIYDGTADLVLNVIWEFPLYISDAYYNELTLISGEELSAYISITNNSLEKYDGYTLYAYANNEMLFKKEYSDTIFSGEIVTQNILIPLPSTVDFEEVILYIVPNGEALNLDDVSGVLLLNLYDISLEYPLIVSENDQDIIQVSAVNRGIKELQNVKLELRKGSSDSDIIQEVTIASILPNSEEIISFVLDTEALESDIYYVTANEIENENKLSNNSVFAIKNRGIQEEILVDNIVNEYVQLQLDVSESVSDLTENIFVFIPSNTATYSFESFDNDFDTYGYILDANMNELVSDDDGGSGNNFKVKYELTANKVYFLKSTVLSDETSGTYSVKITQIAKINKLEITALPNRMDYYVGFEDFSYYGLKVRATFEDGSTVDWSYDSWESLAGYDVEINNDYFDNTYLETIVSCGGKTATFKFNIKENPVDHLELVSGTSRNYIENYNGYINSDGNFIYLTSHPYDAVIKIVYTDGTSVTAKVGEYVDNHYISWNDNQSNTPWLVGTDNSSTIIYLGHTVNLPITVEKNKVASIEVVSGKFTCIENAYGYETGDGYYYYYDVPSDISVKINYTDGTSKTVGIRDTVDGYGFSWDDDQYETPWVLGDDNYLTLSYLGITTQLPVSVIANPVDHIVINSAPTREYVYGDTEYGYLYSDDDYEFYPTDLSGLSFTVYYVDGTNKTFTAEDINEYGDINGYGYELYYDEYNAQIGDFPVQFMYMGKTADYVVKLKESAVSSIAVTKQPNKTEFGNYYSPDFIGMEITITYTDETTKVVTLTDDNLVYEYNPGWGELSYVVDVDGYNLIIEPYYDEDMYYVAYYLGAQCDITNITFTNGKEIYSIELGNVSSNGDGMTVKLMYTDETTETLTLHLVEFFDYEDSSGSGYGMTENGLLYYYIETYTDEDGNVEEYIVSILGKDITVEAETVVIGDVDGDGVCNIRDATILRRYVAKWDGVTVNELAADVNNDGVVNIRDATILRRHVAKWGGYEDLPYTS